MAFLIRMRFALILAIWLSLGAPFAARAQDNSFFALCYHEVEADNTAQLSRTAIHVSDLAAQFSWLKAVGYHPVSLQQIIDARHGGQPLPDKAILLTFDDGKKDVYLRVFPLLKLFHYPAVIALVGSWLEVSADAMVDYDGQSESRDQFVNWDEVNQMQQSGLIEIASHSYALHRGVLANPQGNTQPAATTRLFNHGRYESDQQYLARLKQDMLQNRALIAQKTGQSPRAIVWPYGRSNLAAQQIAADNDLPIGMTLIDGVNTTDVPLTQIRRHIIEQSPSLQSFAEALQRVWAADPARSVWVQPAQWPEIETGLSVTLDKLQRLSANISFIDPRNTMAPNESILFPSSRRAMGHDELNRIAWQLERRAGSTAFITIPKNWLDDWLLLGDLARSVNFAGVRLPIAPGDPRAEKIIATLAQWCWPLRIAYASPLLDSPEGYWSHMNQNDLLIIPWSKFSSAAFPVARANQILIEFDPIQDDKIADHMRKLEAAGYRQFGLTGIPDQGPIWRALSLRSQPLLP